MEGKRVGWPLHSHQVTIIISCTLIGGPCSICPLCPLCPPDTSSVSQRVLKKTSLLVGGRSRGKAHSDFPEVPGFFKPHFCSGFSVLSPSTPSSPGPLNHLLLVSVFNVFLAYMSDPFLSLLAFFFTHCYSFSFRHPTESCLLFEISKTLRGNGESNCNNKKRLPGDPSLGH